MGEGEESTGVLLETPWHGSNLGGGRVGAETSLESRSSREIWWQKPQCLSGECLCMSVWNKVNKGKSIRK